MTARPWRHAVCIKTLNEWITRDRGPERRFARVLAFEAELERRKAARAAEIAATIRPPGKSVESYRRANQQFRERCGADPAYVRLAEMVQRHRERYFRLRSALPLAPSQGAAPELYRDGEFVGWEAYP